MKHFPLAEDFVDDLEPSMADESTDQDVKNIVNPGYILNPMAETFSAKEIWDNLAKMFEEDKNKNQI